MVTIESYKEKSILLTDEITNDLIYSIRNAHIDDVTDFWGYCVNKLRWRVTDWNDNKMRIYDETTKRQFEYLGIEE